jgi:protein TonB
MRSVIWAAALVTIGLIAVERVHAGQAASEPAPVRVGGDVKPPVRVKFVKPEYPAVARQTRVQGVVILEATIGVDGKVKSTKVIKSISILDASATAAVKQWEFKPPLVGGKPTPVIMTIPVNFTLD